MGKKDVMLTDGDMPVYEYDKEPDAGFGNAPPPAMPQLKILQPTNKDLGQDGTPFADMKAGSIFHTLTYQDSITNYVIPCYFARHWVEWEGEFGHDAKRIASYQVRPDNVVWVPGKGLKRPGGTFVSESRMFYCLVVNPDQRIDHVGIGFHRTSIKASSDWLKALQTPIVDADKQQLIHLPIYARRWILATERVEEADKAWYIWRINLIPSWVDPQSAVFAEAREFNNLASQRAASFVDSDSGDDVDAPVDDRMPF